jgi:hypothetical protein
MKNLIFAVIAAIGLSGCHDASEYKNAAALTANSFSNPTQVGTLPDGRPVSVVYHYVVGEHDKSIYFVSDGGVTTNRLEPRGKVLVNRAEFMAPPNLVPVNAKIDLAFQKLKQAQKLVDEAKALTDSLK